MSSIRMLSFFLALMVFGVHTNARNVIRINKYAILDHISEEGSRSFDGSPDFFCSPCLEVSREVEKILADPKLQEKASMISNEFCRLLPSDLQLKCLATAKTYVQQAVVILKDYFSEDKLCNSTGFCPQNTYATVSMISKQESLSGCKIANEIMSKLLMSSTEEKEDSSLSEATTFEMHLQDPIDEVSDDKSCAACHNALDQILNDLQNPQTKMNVLKVLFKACEKVNNHVKECKKLVFEYAPIVLANVEKFLNNNDVCSILRICNGAATETTLVAEV